MIENGNKVKFTLTAKIDSENLEESSTYEIQIGDNNIKPIFTEAMIGKSVGDKINITDKLYGERDETKFASIKRENLPEGISVNQFITAKSKDNPSISQKVRVADITDEEVSIDLNHPYAGMDISCEIEILEVA